MNFFLKALVALFTIVDPIGMAPIVVGLTAHLSPAVRRRVVTRATLIATGVVAVFALFGKPLLEFLGITPEAFSIAGGALLFLVSIDMLFGRESGARETGREAREAKTREDISVFPLAIPLIAGPGTITTVILLMDSAQGHASRQLAVAAAVAIVMFCTWVSMSLAFPIQKRMGTTGTLVLSRVLGMLLAAIAIQYILNGLSSFAESLRTILS